MAGNASSLWLRRQANARSSSLAAKAERQLHVLGHDGHAFGVYGAQVGVLKQAHQVGFGRLLDRLHSGAVEAQVDLRWQAGGGRYGITNVPTVPCSGLDGMQQCCSQSFPCLLPLSYLDVLSNLAHEALEGQLADQQRGGGLVLQGGDDAEDVCDSLEQHNNGKP